MEENNKVPFKRLFWSSFLAILSVSSLGFVFILFLIGAIAGGIMSGLEPDAIALKDVPAGRPYKIITVDDLPGDRTFRNAWEVDAAILTDGVGGDSNEFPAKPEPVEGPAVEDPAPTEPAPVEEDVQ